MKENNFYKESGQMDLSDRIAIETGLSLGEAFSVIGKRLGRHPSTISHEVKENRTYIDCFDLSSRKRLLECQEMHGKGPVRVKGLSHSLQVL